ncbi:UNVERIFIED_ORG: hypothetical protein ABID33_000235 [Xanthobacter viscosus]|uniref:Uncharacterized protein n=1 Tax=Xanthobacter autotrophicus TaxID=280 RepID=A0A6C1KJ70_XANAU|nr:hypothetical protein [Xanthobacter autotrophicus]TLX43871.1 hypothetical protein FBQ73_07160 [Xanthobacter autotrophicus]
MTVSLRHQAEEAELDLMEYRDWIEILSGTQDEKARRTPEQLANMRIRLGRKEAIAETLGRLADRADARRAAEQGSTAA